VVSLRRSRLEHNITFTSPNSVLWNHHEFERESGGVRAILYIVYFLDFYEEFPTYYLHPYMYIYWPLA
jgi:hypothetical protein